MKNKKLRERPFLDYFGGKFRLAPWIISHFPKHEIYCEPFCGAASVLMRKDPSKMEVLNDLDSEIFNVFKVARNHGAKLKKLLKLTPYSRKSYLEARVPVQDPVEMAKNTVIKSFMGIGDSIHNKSGFRKSITSNVPPSRSFANYVDYFDFFTERLRSVLIENLSYNEIFKAYDSNKTLFYIDPPYPHFTRSKKHRYGHEMTENCHNILIERILTLKGRVILSSYKNPVYDSLNWRTELKEARTQKTKRTEVLYINF